MREVLVFSRPTVRRILLVLAVAGALSLGMASAQAASGTKSTPTQSNTPTAPATGGCPHHAGTLSTPSV